MKEKIGIEKLIELLNESEKERKSDLYYKFELENGVLYCYDDVTDVLWTMQDEAMVICSKQFGFIKWLVENDKIDFELDSIIHKHKGIDFNTGKGIAVEKLCDKYESLLMLIAIQDEPIRFLCEILK